MRSTIVRWIRWLAGVVSRLVAAVRRRWRREWIYADEVVLMDADGLTIRHYYWPVGRKRIQYGDIRDFEVRPLTMGRGQYRVQGIDLRGRWYSRDRSRRDKARSIVLDVGSKISPVLTPTDTETVVEILRRHVRRA